MGDGLGVERGVPEGPLPRAIRPHQQPRAGVGAADRRHEGRALVAPGGLGERALGAHGSYRSTHTSISPPQGRPTSQASLSGMP